MVISARVWSLWECTFRSHQYLSAPKAQHFLLVWTWRLDIQYIQQVFARQWAFCLQSLSQSELPKSIIADVHGQCRSHWIDTLKKNAVIIPPMTKGMGWNPGVGMSVYQDFVQIIYFLNLSLLNICNQTWYAGTSLCLECHVGKKNDLLSSFDVGCIWGILPERDVFLLTLTLYFCSVIMLFF